LTIRHQKGKHCLILCFIGSPPTPTSVDGIALKEEEEAYCCASIYVKKVMPG